LLENCLLFDPSLLAHFEGVLSLLELSLEISHSLLVQVLVVVRGGLHQLHLLVVFLLQAFMLSVQVRLRLLGLGQVFVEGRNRVVEGALLLLQCHLEL